MTSGVGVGAAAGLGVGVVAGAGTFSGKPVRRVEDPDLLRGAGTYVDNLKLDGMLTLHFVRSPIAHAALLSVDATAAREMPGVVGVYSAADLDLPDAPALMKLHPDAVRPSLAKGTVNFVGDPVAVVVADSRAHAMDAAELVEVDYEPLGAAVDMEGALAPDSPLQFEAIGSNVVVGMRSGSDDPLAGAEVIVRGRFENQRLAVVPMEGSAIVVDPTAPGFDLTVHLACQMPHMIRGSLSGLLGLEPGRVRVIAPNVGGSFGAKHLSVEGVVAAKLSLELGRPVKWVETRSESMVAMPHGRGQVQYVELGLTRDGTMVGMRCRMIGDAGAYGGFGGILVVAMTKLMAQGVYRIPKIAYDVGVVVTNTTPMGAYRGAGRPEAAAFLERIVDMAADELEMDPAELRRKNFIRPDAFPLTTLMGAEYDSGEYEVALDEVLRIADYDGLRREQEERRARGDRLQLGIGLACYVEVTGGGAEFAEVEVHDDGMITVRAGTSAHGQGHATAFSQIAADQFGVPIERIRYVQSDTALVARGGGTGGSRSVQLGGTAVLETSRLVVERAKKLVADLLEAAPEDIVATGDGMLGVAGVPDTSLGWAEISRAASAQGEPLLVQHDTERSGSTFPFGAHIAVVEVDTETGRVVPVRHFAVDDCGVIVNPLLVDGQVHGGLASGIAQALWEQFLYDDDGNPLTSTLAEYGIPSAAELPSFTTAHTETPSPLNGLGAKGIGESATVGSTPALQNAVVDALSHLGVRHIDMPCTPERVWRAIEAARAGTLPDPWREPPAAMAAFAVEGAEGEDLESGAESVNL
ncbi:MAG: xanthine dehydrogenase family protein molybdopterin-binding subunit [Acidimicrobiales bacterium]